MRVVVLFEGRDASGKGGSIKRFKEHLNPRSSRVVALTKPTDVERGQWYFRRYIKELPDPGELVFFDRSWYSRALIQPAMGYCKEAQYKYFMRKINSWEEEQMNNGLILIKFYLSVSKENQELRFHMRETSSLKYWKLSANDWEAHKKWRLFTSYKEQMFRKTSTRIISPIILAYDLMMMVLMQINTF